jgi:hypothetical protein
MPGSFNFDSDYHPEIYARMMMTLGHGYAPFVPEPTDDPEAPNEAYTKVGVESGDVVLLNEDGGYDYVFNCTLSINHPKNVRGVPDGHQPFTLVPGNRRSTPFFSAGARLRTSGGVERDVGLNAFGQLVYVLLCVYHIYIYLRCGSIAVKEPALTSELSFLATMAPCFRFVKAPRGSPIKIPSAFKIGP